MQEYQKLYKQLEALNKLKSFLEKYRLELDTQLGIYRGWCQNMQQEGVPTQVALSYVNDHYKNNESCIKRTIDNIDQKDLPFIKRQIKNVEDALEALRRLGK